MLIVPRTSLGLVSPHSDSRPVLLYLGRLSGEGPRTQMSALEVVSEIICGMEGCARYLAWHDVTYEHAAAVRMVLMQRDLAPATVNRYLSALRGVLKECWRIGRITAEHYHTASSVENVKSCRPPAGRSVTELELLLLTEQADPLELCMLALLFGAGMRRAEATGVRKEDVFGRSDTIWVRVHGKGRKTRDVPLPRSWSAHVVAVVEGLEDGEAVLGLTVDQVRHRLDGLCARSKMKRISPHDLRRTYVTRLLEKGADLGMASSLAGHSDPRTTKRYDRRGDASMVEAVDRL